MALAGGKWTLRCFEYSKRRRISVCVCMWPASVQQSNIFDVLIAMKEHHSLFSSAQGLHCGLYSLTKASKLTNTWRFRRFEFFRRNNKDFPSLLRKTSPGCTCKASLSSIFLRNQIGKENSSRLVQCPVTQLQLLC